MTKYYSAISEDNLNTTIRTLELFRYEVLNGYYEGWGLDDNMILCVKHWLENIKEGVYEK